MWVMHDGFLGMVSDSWCAPVGVSNPIRRVMLKLKRLKLCLREWNLNIFRNTDIQIADLEASLARVQADISSGEVSDGLLLEEISLQADLSEKLDRKNNYLHQRSRINWLKDGDRNTKFFHHSLRMRRASSGISTLMVDGEICTDEEHIASHIVDFYKNLFAPSVGVQPDLEGIVNLIDGNKKVTRAHKDCLTACPDENETRKAVFDIDADSSPGPNGYTGKFFQVAWEVIYEDIVAAVKYFFIHSCMPPGLNSSWVALLPKIEAPSSIVDYRPIVMSNFLFKIISKIIASRLNGVVNSLISFNQFGFIMGRNIHEAILLASEGYS